MESKAEADSTPAVGRSSWSAAGAGVTAAGKEGKEAANTSIEASVQGKDYPEGKVGPQPPRIFWTEVKAYRPYFKEWKNRPEYKARLKKFN